eukprot:gene45175-55261_t
MSRFVIDENFAPGNRGRNTLVLNLGEEIATDDSSTAKGSDIMIYANGNVPSNTNNVENLKSEVQMWIQHSEKLQAQLNSMRIEKDRQATTIDEL